jgi:hypothetical protein
MTITRRGFLQLLAATVAAAAVPRAPVYELSDCHVYSLVPFSGRIQPGDYLEIGDEVVRVTRVEPGCVMIMRGRQRAATDTLSGGWA